MSSKKKIIFLTAGILLLLILADISYNYLSKQYSKKDISSNNESIDKSNNQETNKEKIMAPDFFVYNKDGKQVNLSDYKGKKNIVINFWATWCNPCKEELPYFEKAINTYKDKDIEFLMIALTDGQRETKETVDSFINKNAYKMNVLYDLDYNAATKYNIYTIPRTIFIDKNGDISYDFNGQISENILTSNINKLLRN